MQSQTWPTTPQASQERPHPENLTQDKRQLIMEKILNTAAQARSEGMSILATGDFGMGMSGIAQCVIDYDQSFNTEFSPRIDIFINDTQTMQCLFDSSLKTRKLDATQSQRALILQYGADSAPSDVAQLAGDPSLRSSGGGAAEPHPALRMISIKGRFLNSWSDQTVTWKAWRAFCSTQWFRKCF